LIEQAKSIFEKNIYYPIDMDELTDILNINYQQLRDQFRGKTGVSPSQWSNTTSLKDLDLWEG
jgi:transcriptional regulator GlxA family with amidase domain